MEYKRFKLTTLTDIEYQAYLERKFGERFMIGDDVSWTILGVRGNQIRLGVDAPREVEVYREEIYRKVQRERNTDDDNRGNC